MTRFVFVRHGQADAAENRCIGHTDVALSAGGGAAIRQLVATPTPPRGSDVRVVSSDLRRASDSAAIIGAAIGRDVAHDARLREMNFGSWDGQSWKVIERREPERFQHWMHHWLDVAPPGGESATDLGARAAQWTSDTLASTHEDERIIVVSHAGWIRAALTHLFARDPGRMFDIAVDYARATIVDVSAIRRAVVAANSTSLDA